MTETSGRTLRRWLLTAVADLGEAPRAEVHANIERLFGADFTVADRAPRVGRGDEAAWRNNVDSLFDRLKKSGVMSDRRARSPWALTSVGQREAATYQPPSVVIPPVAEMDLLSDFKPKDSSEYRAHMQGRTLIKQREHEAVVRAYGHAMADEGWRPLTSVHPRDLELQRPPMVWLAEIKVVYRGDATEAVRAALAQLLMYRHFLYGQDEQPGLVAVFSESVGAAYVDFLHHQGVAAVWRDATGWNGSEAAHDFGLVPTLLVATGS